MSSSFITALFVSLYTQGWKHETPGEECIQLLTTVHSTLLQGVPINMGTESRLEYRLRFSIFDKGHEVLQKKMEYLINFPKWGLPSLNL